MEIWKPAFAYEAHYEVSDLGRARRIGKDRMGRCRNTMLRNGFRRGYLNFTLCVDGVPKTFGVHRLVWESFHGKIPDGMQINHLNGDKHDNRLVNLEVVTPSQNAKYNYTHLGQVPVKNPRPGMTNGRATISDDCVREIRRRYASEKISQLALAKEYGIDQTSVSRIVLRKGWAHVM